MKIALVNLNMDEYEPPFGLAYLASYVRKYGGFSNFVIIDKENPIAAIKREKPDIVGISSMTHEFMTAKQLATQIKDEFDLPLIIGGIHITLVPAHFAKSSFDVAVIGEGEQTFLELLQFFEKKGSFDSVYLKNVKGIVFRNKNKIVQAEPRPLIENLDTIPFPARDLLEMKQYIKLQSITTEIGIYGQVVTSRGCPYRCVYCSSAAFWTKARFHSAEYVVREIKELAEKYRVDHIGVWDDLFFAHKKRLEEIVKLLKREGLNKRLIFSVAARANLMDEHACRLLKEMNVKCIGFGLESGSEKVLKYLKRGTVNVEQNREAIKLCKQAGMKTQGLFIIGSPDETEEDLQQTLNLVNDKNLDQIQVFQLTPLPGTEVWEYAKNKGLVSDDDNFDLNKLRMIGGFKEDFVMTEHISAEKLKDWFWLFQNVSAKKMRRGILSNLKNIRPNHVRHMLNYNFIKRIVGVSTSIMSKKNQ